MSWIDDNEARLMYSTAVRAAVMKDERYNTLSVEEVDKKIAELESNFYLDTKPLINYDNPYAATQAFKEWLEMSSMVLKSAIYEVSITRTYGSTTVTYGMKGNFDASTVQNQQRGYQFLERIVERQHAQWAAKASTNDRPTGAVNGNGNQDANVTYEEMPVEKIVVSHDGTKQIVKVHGGKWSKFGVFIWPEVIDATGYLKASEMRMGETKYTGTAKVQMRDGKPQRIVKLEVF